MRCLLFLIMMLTCLWNLRSVENVIPKCLCVSVFVGMLWPAKCRVGVIGCFLRLKVCWTVFVLLNFIAHCFAYSSIASRSLSTIIHHNKHH